MTGCSEKVKPFVVSDWKSVTQIQAIYQVPCVGTECEHGCLGLGEIHSCLSPTCCYTQQVTWLNEWWYGMADIPSIYCLYLSILLPISSEVQGAPWTGYLSITGQHRDVQSRQPRTHKHRKSINQTVMFSFYGRKPEFLSKARTCRERTVKLHAERRQAGIGTQDCFAAKEKCYQCESHGKFYSIF